MCKFIGKYTPCFRAVAILYWFNKCDFIVTQNGRMHFFSSKIGSITFSPVRV